MVGALVCAICVVAASVVSPGGPSKEAPVAYRCDRLRMVRAEHHGTCQGNVVVRQGDLLLCCDTLKGQADAQGAWQSFVCEGDVRGTQGDLSVWAGRATFDGRTQQLVLSAQPRSRRGQSTLWGRRMVVSTVDGNLDVDTPRGQLALAPDVHEAAAPLLTPLSEGRPLPSVCPLPKGPSPQAPAW